MRSLRGRVRSTNKGRKDGVVIWDSFGLTTPAFRAAPPFQEGDFRLVHNPTRRIADPLIELIDFVQWCAEIFEQSLPGIRRLNVVFRNQMEALGLAHPWFGVDDRIGNRHFEFEGVVIDSGPALLDLLLIAVRITEMIYPRSLVISRGLYY